MSIPADAKCRDERKRYIQLAQLGELIDIYQENRNMQFDEMGKTDGKVLFLLPGTACDYQTNFDYQKLVGVRPPLQESSGT